MLVFKTFNPILILSKESVPILCLHLPKNVIFSKQKKKELTTYNEDKGIKKIIILTLCKW
jgi:hypothetical protein